MTKKHKPRRNKQRIRTLEDPYNRLDTFKREVELYWIPIPEQITLNELELEAVRAKKSYEDFRLKIVKMALKELGIKGDIDYPDFVGNRKIALFYWEKKLAIKEVKTKKSLRSKKENY